MKEEVKKSRYRKELLNYHRGEFKKVLDKREKEKEKTGKKGKEAKSQEK